MKKLDTEILRTLLYYDIWHHPLTSNELFTFLPVNSLSYDEFDRFLRDSSTTESILQYGGYYYVRGKTSAIVAQRRSKERHAHRMWRLARLSAMLIKRFPFVRAIFVSGDLSKNVTNSKSDVDFFILTEPGRLWITRTLLILFKKILLLNSKKFFCVNYLSTTDHLTFDDRNIFSATEIATLKPLFNAQLFHRYLEANGWIREFFPNYDIRGLSIPSVSNAPSKLQGILEWPFRFVNAEALDVRLMHMMHDIWANRYPDYDEETRSKIFRCTPQESRAYVGNFQEKILAIYEQRLREFGIGTKG